MALQDYYKSMEFEDFQKIQTPVELHTLATKCYFYIQQWIVESKLCSEATALMIFWNSSPYEYISYSWKTRKGTNEDFDLIRTIIDNFEKAFYLKTDIRYDPSKEIAKSVTIPDIVLQASNGEEPYIYLEEKEVKNWFGEYLQNQIKRCDSAIELYNIVVFLKHKELGVYKAVIEQQFCDKAIALMMYWQLQRYSNLSLYAEDWLEIKKILEDIIQKLQNNEYLEALLYDPNKEVKPIKWKIPENLFNKIN